MGFIPTHCFASSVYANYHGKLEFFHFHLPSLQEQLMSSVSVSKVGLSVYIYLLSNCVCRRGQGLSFESTIFLLMFTVHSLMQQKFIPEYLNRFNSNSCSVSSIFSNTPENLNCKQKITLSKLARVIIMNITFHNPFGSIQMSTH